MRCSVMPSDALQWRFHSGTHWVLDEVVDGRSARTTAAVLAAVAVASCMSLILFFVVGGPFGTINDLGNGTLAVLCGVLASALYAPGRAAATTVAVVGAATS